MATFVLAKVYRFFWAVSELGNLVAGYTLVLLFIVCLYGLPQCRPTVSMDLLSCSFEWRRTVVAFSGWWLMGSGVIVLLYRLAEDYRKKGSRPR